MIALIDYGAGNLHSVQNALCAIGKASSITSDPLVLQQASAAILPGVGSFGHAMACMQKAELVKPVLRFIESGKPFLGICLGLQLLFEESAESPGIKGLGVLRGKIERLPGDRALKVPHIGWNSLNIRQKNGIFTKIPEEPYVYFVHSYYLKAEDRGIVSATANYGVEFDAAIQKENLHAAQFHPEKSGERGLEMLQNFAAMAE